MKRPLLGIFIVLCLQLGFTAYNAVDRPIESLFVVNEIPSGMNPVADMPESLNDSELIISTQNSRASKHSGQPSLISSRKTLVVPPVVAAYNVPRSAVLQKPLESITITYPRTTPTRVEYAKPHTLARVALRTEKRSFVSKSVSVLKKPYDWIKALGSRIN